MHDESSPSICSQHPTSPQPTEHLTHHRQENPPRYPQPGQDRTLDRYLASIEQDRQEWEDAKATRSDGVTAYVQRKLEKERARGKLQEPDWVRAVINLGWDRESLGEEGRLEDAGESHEDVDRRRNGHDNSSTTTWEPLTSPPSGLLSLFHISPVHNNSNQRDPAISSQPSPSHIYNPTTLPTPSSPPSSDPIPLAQKAKSDIQRQAELRLYHAILAAEATESPEYWEEKKNEMMASEEREWQRIREARRKLQADVASGEKRLVVREEVINVNPRPGHGRREYGVGRRVGEDERRVFSTMLVRDRGYSGGGAKCEDVEVPGGLAGNPIVIDDGDESEPKTAEKVDNDDVVNGDVVDDDMAPRYEGLFGCSRLFQSGSAKGKEGGNTKLREW